MSETKGVIIAAVITGSLGIVGTLLAQSDRSFAFFMGDLPPSICTTKSGEIGRVQLITHIFNSDRTPHGHNEIHPVSASGEYRVSDNDVQDIRDVTERLYLEKRWGAKWECVL